MLNIQQIVGRVNALRYRATSRDMRNGDVQMVRQGKISQVYPNFFPDGLDQNVVATISAMPRCMTLLAKPTAASVRNLRMGSA